MSVPDLEVQRSRAFKQLSAARDRKLTMGRGEAALAALNAADQLIESIPELKELRAEIAYRKGHLLLRTAVSWEDLEKADFLFARALHSETRLAPWARVYRVAILGRLLALDATEQRKRNLEQGRKLACAAVKDAIGANPFDIQHAAFNLLEVVTYALGLDYPALEGLGASDASIINVAEEESALVVSPDPASARVKVAWDYAVCEADDRAAGDEGAVTFRLPRDGDPTVRVGSDEWKPLTLISARWLAAILECTRKDRSAIARRACGEEGDCESKKNKSLIRQQLGRTQDVLNELLGRKHTLQTAGVPRLGEGVRVYGAVSHARLAERYR